MGDGNFRPPQNPHPLTDHQKMVQVIKSAAPMAAPSLVQIRPREASGHMGEIKQFFLFIPFFMNSPIVRPVDGFSRLQAQRTRTRAKVCLLGVSLILLPILGVKSPPNPSTQFWGVNRRFQVKRANIESFMLSKPQHRFQANFAQR